MTEGTKSYLFGAHQFLIHPLIVIVAWKKHHGRMPRLWELVCIFLHDIGHIGKQYLSDVEEKRKHWILGARIGQKLFGYPAYALIAGHSTASGLPRSKLFWADKFSWVICPMWWILLNDKVEKFGSQRSPWEFRRRARENWRAGCPRGSHDIYLELVKENGRRKR